MRDEPANILIVDDVAENLRVLSDLLARANYVVRPVTSGRMALKTMESALPDLILLDVSMPGMNGFELCRLLQAGDRTNQIPVVFISALAEAGEKVKAFEAGGVDYITKPFHAAEVLARVNTHLALRQTRARLQELNCELEQRVQARTEELQEANRVLQDEIRERRQIEEALRQSEGRYRLLIETTREGVWQVDAAGQTTFVNVRMAEMLGYARDELLGHFPWEFVAENDIADARERQRRRERGLRDTAENRYQRKDGSALWTHAQSFPLFDEHGGPAGAVGMLTDITEQQASNELRTRLAAIVAGSEDAIIGETLDGAISSWNDGAARLYGYAAAEVVGRPMAMLLEDARVAEPLQGSPHPAHAAHGAPFDTVHRRKDGSLVDVAVRRSPIRDARGSTVGVSTIARDISERRRAEELRRRSEALEEENRRVLEESRLKSGFLANMSHEFRTPLTAIAGFAELLHEGRAGGLSEDHLQIVGNILISARHLTHLVNDVLDLARVEAGKTSFRPELVDVAQAVREVRAVLQTMIAEKQLRITTGTDRGLGPVVVDAGRLKQVLYNYLSNAIKFTPPDGRITITVQAEGDEAFRASVRDSGIGIPPDALHQLFTEFVQLDPRVAGREQGTGLGLALTKRIVEAQGGSVGVRSAPGKGSTFYAVLPRRPRPSTGGTIPAS